MNPGTSIKNNKGILNASHNWINFAALSAESGNKTPPFTLGWLAIIPTTLPSIRASPVINSGANSFLISRNCLHQ